MTSKEVFAELSYPYEPSEVKWKPQTVKGNRAMAICYIDARAVMDRLDEVLGPDGWQDDYQILPDGTVACRLRLKIGGEWVTKMDVGSPSEQPDFGDRAKAAFSDALKRAAVKFGVGRYLYSLGNQWCDYDPVKKQFTGKPTLPARALPDPKGVAKRLARDIEETTDLDDLLAAWQTVNAQRSTLEATVYAHLVKVKDQRKAELTTAPTAKGAN